MLIAGYHSAAEYCPSGIPGSGDPKSEARKPRSAAQALGQVFTPAPLAARMVEGLALGKLGKHVRLLDPSVGPDTFPSALRNSQFHDWRLDAIDVDPAMCAEVAAANDPRVVVHRGDYLSRPLQIYDAAILNPPYVRQEWLRDKRRAQAVLRDLTGIEVPGTSNLYVYFIVKTVAELREGGRMACLVYDSWQSTLFGRWLRSYLDEHCVWHSEEVPDCPFEGRLIDATIIYATKTANARDIDQTAAMAAERQGFAPISDLFVSRRGLRLKQSDFFMTTIDRQAEEGSTPFVKKVARIGGFSVKSDHPEAALLLERDGKDGRTFAEIERRLAAARRSPTENVSILTWCDERPERWFAHRKPPTDVIIFNYYLRHRPRHILNPGGRGYSDNFYGITPRTPVAAYAWLAALNSTASTLGVLCRARNQGAGLAKLQLFEYREAQVVDIREWGSRDLDRLESLGRQLASEDGKSLTTIKKIDDLIAGVFDDPTLCPSILQQEVAAVDRRVKRPVRECR